MAKSYVLGFACFVLLVAMVSATQFRVGGQRGWSVPDANIEPYKTWAGRNRFQIGDQLLFVYPKDKDSVLLVEQNEYNSCNTSSYVKKFDDGNTVFTFDRSGPFFFISGSEANCRSNEKLIIVVLADRSGRAPPPPIQPGVAPSPSSTPSTQPSASPSSPPGVAPSPSSTPSTQPSASPSSAPGVATSPSSTPSTQPSPSPATPSNSPIPNPSSAPASAPATTPGSSPSPSAPTGGGASTPPAPVSSPPCCTEGGNSTSPSANQQNGAATMMAGLISSLGAYIGYAILAL